MYQCILYILQRSCGELEPAIYRFDNKKIPSIQKCGPLTDGWEKCFYDKEQVFGAPHIVCIVGDLSKHLEKYSNRGYLYTVIEVGHIAQNIALAAAELGVGCIEYGGYFDLSLAKVVGLEKKPSNKVLLVVGLGA